MSDDEFDQYLNGRYARAVKWYDRRASKNKWGYILLSLYVILGSGFLTVASTFKGDTWRIADAVVAATITAGVSVLGLLKLHENWLSYRASWDALSREPELRNARIGVYRDTSDRNALFVEQVEAIMAHEGAEWLERHRGKKLKGGEG